jgi:hypothetical protein
MSRWILMWLKDGESVRFDIDSSTIKHNQESRIKILRGLEAFDVSALGVINASHDPSNGVVLPQNILLLPSSSLK